MTGWGLLSGKNKTSKDVQFLGGVHVLQGSEAPRLFIITIWRKSPNSTGFTEGGDRIFVQLKLRLLCVADLGFHSIAGGEN